MTAEVPEIAIIDNVYLGFEDHGILTLILHLKGEGGGWGQGFGTFTYGATSSPESWSETDQWRAGRALANSIIGLLNTFGINDFSKLAGKTVLVKRDKPFGTIEAIKPLSFSRSSEWLSLRDIAEFA